jgi:hypothetical protein
MNNRIENRICKVYRVISWLWWFNLWQTLLIPSYTRLIVLGFSILMKLYKILLKYYICLLHMLLENQTHRHKHYIYHKWLHKNMILIIINPKTIHSFISHYVNLLKWLKHWSSCIWVVINIGMPIGQLQNGAHNWERSSFKGVQITLTLYNHNLGES